ncbi:MAG: hypothetical protein CMM50_13620 [Rhodospirillaceae bacterium]|jgi:hypothetical protein|nr:hypothetical protein [Rhodospirillaceae bacterium]|tara:strand:- start:484 stop:852 length:369 start_codon:yes stop_codon:yes gene_type:complete
MSEETSQDIVHRYVAELLQHAQSALWPERRAALQSFREGIDRSDRGDVEAALDGLGVELRNEDDGAEVLFRIVLTVYLTQLDDSEITNPDQAALFLWSLDEHHIERAEMWFQAHPEHPQTVA